jgi:NAD(P)-dependent dehydrogenase (short-subunit alcohol dehydrogenase family)
VPPPGKGDAYVHDLAGATPLQRRPAPADVAEAVAYLLGAEAVTGQTIFVDGGQRLA